MPRKADARTFGQDLMRGEHQVGKGKKNGTRAVQTQDWVRDKIEAGDIEGGMAGDLSGTSIFDPVLCEIAYRWFCPPGGIIFDPFAGGSVRGIVAARLDRTYIGVDLRPEQIAANEAQADAILTPDQRRLVAWIEGDSAKEAGARLVRTDAAKQRALDFIFTCPPYFDLERYSDDPRDLSTMTWPAFVQSMRTIISACAASLADHRFACWVTSDVRDKAGVYRRLPHVIAGLFEEAGMPLYNEAILVQAAGSLPIRVRRQFESARKLGRTHQIVQVFIKGDPRKATAAVGACEFGEVDMTTAAPAPALGGAVDA